MSAALLLRQAGSLCRQVVNNRETSSLLVRTLAGTAASKVVMLDSYKSYNDHIKSQESPSVVYFTAVWCPPCRAIKPVYHELSNKYPKVVFGQLDVDAVDEAAVNAGIRSVPAFHFYHKGKVYNKFVGADPSKLEETLKDLTEKA